MQDTFRPFMWKTHILPTESAISGQNSSTISFSLSRANSFNRMLGSSSNAITPTVGKWSVHIKNNNQWWPNGMCVLFLTSRSDAHFGAFAEMLGYFQHFPVRQNSDNWLISRPKGASNCPKIFFNDKPETVLLLCCNFFVPSHKLFHPKLLAQVRTKRKPLVVPSCGHLKISF